MNGKELERLARQFSNGFWTPGEVLYYCYREAEGLEPTDRIPAIRNAVSLVRFQHLQNAASLVLESMHPDADYFALGFITPEVPPAMTEIPRSFVEAMISDDAQA